MSCIWLASCTLYWDEEADDDHEISVDGGWGDPWTDAGPADPWPGDAGPGDPWTGDAGPGDPWPGDAGPGDSWPDGGIDPWPDAGSWPPDGGVDPWPDAGPGDGCYAIAVEAICVVTAGCDPVYVGIDCSCDSNGACSCDSWDFVECRAAN